jgi:hypothetical protein
MIAIRNAVPGSRLPALLLAGVLALGGLAACSGESPAPSSKIPAAADPLPAGLLVKTAPAGAKDVLAVKAVAKEGEKVVLRGRIGTLSPFVEGLAAMTLVDSSLTPCNEMTMEDGCPTPWDYCCTPPDALRAGSATVQVVGADGSPLRHDLRLEGLAPLWHVVVEGTVAPRPDAKVLVVSATSIHVEKEVTAGRGAT